MSIQLNMVGGHLYSMLSGYQVHFLAYFFKVKKTKSKKCSPVMHHCPIPFSALLTRRQRFLCKAPYEIQLAKTQRTIVLSIGKAGKKDKGFPSNFEILLHVPEGGWPPLLAVKTRAFLLQEQFTDLPIPPPKLVG